MTERLPRDPFDELVASLQHDDSYTASIEELNAQFIGVEQQEARDKHPGLFGQHRPNFTTPITDVGQAIYDKFVELCGIYGVDINRPDQTPEAFEEIQQEIAVFVYGLKREIWQGDTISTQHALVVDMRREEDDAMGVVGLSDGEALVGKFVGPVIGPMPDEMSALTRGELGDPPIGIGLMLEHPVIIEESGEAHADAFDGSKVIVALGTIGLSLHKITYQDGQDL